MQEDLTGVRCWGKAKHPVPVGLSIANTQESRGRLVEIPSVPKGHFGGLRRGCERSLRAEITLSLSHSEEMGLGCLSWVDAFDR